MSDLPNPAVELLVEKIKRHRLEALSLLLLESHLPLANVIAHLAHLIPPVFGKPYLELLKDPKSIEMLIYRLQSS